MDRAEELKEFKKVWIEYYKYITLFNKRMHLLQLTQKRITFEETPILKENKSLNMVITKRKWFKETFSENVDKYISCFNKNKTFKKHFKEKIKKVSKLKWSTIIYNTYLAEPKLETYFPDLSNIVDTLFYNYNNKIKGLVV